MNENHWNHLFGQVKEIEDTEDTKHEKAKSILAMRDKLFAMYIGQTIQIDRPDDVDVRTWNPLASTRITYKQYKFSYVKNKAGAAVTRTE